MDEIAGKKRRGILGLRKKCSSLVSQNGNGPAKTFSPLFGLTFLSFLSSMASCRWKTSASFDPGAPLFRWSTSFLCSAICIFSPHGVQPISRVWNRVNMHKTDVMLTRPSHLLTQQERDAVGTIRRRSRAKRTQYRVENELHAGRDKHDDVTRCERFLPAKNWNGRLRECFRRHGSTWKQHNVRRS